MLPHKVICSLYHLSILQGSQGAKGNFSSKNSRVHFESSSVSFFPHDTADFKVSEFISLSSKWNPLLPGTLTSLKKIARDNFLILFLN